MLAPRPGKLRTLLTGTVLFLATAAFTLWQNSRVAALWDVSFILDTAYRFSVGQVPYRDLPFPYAPLTFLLHTLIIRIFGRVYLPHILCVALAGATATLLAWRLMLRVLAPLGARAWSMATLLAMPLIFLGIYGVYPHPVYDSDCILAVLVALMLMYRAEGSAWENACAGAACVVPLFFKQNIGGPFLLATALAVVAVGITRRLQRQSMVAQGSFLGGAAVAICTAILVIHLTVGAHNYLYWTVTFAAQRRLPGVGAIVGIYRDSSLLWSAPATMLGVLMLRFDRIRKRRWATPLTIALLSAPFVWTVVALARTADADDRAGQLLALWPHVLVLTALLLLRQLRKAPTIRTLLPLVLLATIHGTFLSQQLWGSTYALWPLFLLLIAVLLTQVPTVAPPVAAIVSAALLICGGLYAVSHDRLDYVHLEGTPVRATLPQLGGLTTPGPWIPDFEELVRLTNVEIPPTDQVLVVPGEDPFYFATGRIPQFPILLFDPATDPYTPQETLEQARQHDVRWLIVTRNLQLAGPPHPDLAEITRVLEAGFVPYQSLANYDIYRRK